MKKQNGQFIFSATDLSGFINCKHLTQLNRLAAEGVIKRPIRNNRVTEMLQQKGLDFENSFLENLEAEGKTIARIEQEDNDSFNKTIAAMQSGVDVVYQARLKQDNWQGWADFLIKVDKPSKFGNWSYEVMDTKLATETKSGTILQIALYSQIIQEMQGLMPEIMHVQTPEAHLEYRVDDFISFVRHTKKKFLQSIEDAADTYPELVNHCDVCNWWEICNQKRREDDHLSFIAGMGTAQMKEVRAQGINTLEAMAELALPIPFRPSKGAVPTYTKLREQARLQNESRTQNRPVYELLPLDDPEKGFFNLPEPTKWDVYLDLEGDPLVDPNGREYIIGWWHQDVYNIIWAENAAEEKSAFENFVDQMQVIIAAHPQMHIYHFGAYEPSAFKRLMCKYATRENIIDNWLRNNVFIDLHSIVKHALRAGVERYSLKDLERYHGYLREMDLRTLSGIKAEYELLLETNRVADATTEMRDAIALYNTDDCKSTEWLHKWLERLRQELIDSGEDIPRPVFEYQDPSERITNFELMIQPLIEALTAGVPPEKNDRTPEQQARFILANMLAYYRREEKSYWWEYFRITGLSEDELLEEKSAIAGLEFTEERELIKRSVIDTYRFPFQEYEIKKGDKVIDYFGKIHGEIHDIDKRNNLIKIRKGPTRSEIHTPIIIANIKISAEDKEKAIIALAAWVTMNGMDSPLDEYRAARDLLLRNNPSTAEPVIQTTDSLLKAIDWVTKLNDSILPIQGPPGSGKSYTASRMIVELLKQNKRVGITALSHKVITALLEKTHELIEAEGLDFNIIQKVEDDEETRWKIASETKALAKASSKYDLIAGTPFMWAHGDFSNTVDYLFVDEAGQLSLVDTLAMSRASKNMVLLGDPQQLQQPQQGIHPDGTEVSALEHVLGGYSTITTEQGLFLPVTFRMHPTICSLDSELYYDSKLNPAPLLENQRIEGNTRFAGSGLFYQPVTHAGNTIRSDEEVEAVADIIAEMCKGDVQYFDKNNNPFVVTRDHIKVISPYNGQVQALKDRIPGLSVGTVDKFQGQEAPIIIFSMATSSVEDAPRGMDFLYSPNRFNVAISRARAIFILVANQQVLEPDCKNPHQMKLANSFCRFMEVVG
jgi:uncharacterized protein